MHDSDQTEYSLLDPKNDFVFKRIFTEHPEALVDLINDLRPDLPAITEVEILNPSITPAELEGKHIVLDVLAKDIQGNRYKDWITLFEHWKEDVKMAAVTHESVKKVRGYIRELSADEESRRLAFVRERVLNVVAEEM